MEIVHYLTAEGQDPVQDWLDGMRDLRARVATLRRIERVHTGNLGDHRFCGAGVWEFRIDVGQGYRACYAKAGQTVVLLL